MIYSLTAEDCTIWYNNFFNSLENKFCPLISKEILVKADAPWYDHTVAVLRRQRRRAERGWHRLRSDTSRSDYTEVVELLEIRSCFEKRSSMEVRWLLAKETRRSSVV